MADREDFTAGGEIELPSGSLGCEAIIDADGLSVSDGESALVAWPAHEIATIIRADYDLLVTNAFDDQQIVLRRFARRTDELEVALRRARADALAALMAPPGTAPMDVFDAGGERPGLLYRYDDGLRWVPHTGDCSTRLYSELSAATFDPGAWDLVLAGPFGETRIGGLKRVTRELASETTRHLLQASEQFAAVLEAAALPWGDEARTGRLVAHVPFEATGDRLAQLTASNVICEERREYWQLMSDAGVVERLVLSPGGDGLRAVAICRAREGELYEALSETDHASYVFQDADEVVRAWVEGGFRREPIFSPSERDAAAALAQVLPSLRGARSGLVARVIHDEPGLWERRLFK